MKIIKIKGIKNTYTWDWNDLHLVTLGKKKKNTVRVMAFKRVKQKRFQTLNLST